MHAYRDADDYIVDRRLRQLSFVRMRLREHVPALEAVRASQLARIAAGVVGVTGAVAMLVATVLTPNAPTATYILVGSVAAALSTYAIVRTGARFVAGELTSKGASFERAGTLARDLLRLEESHPMRVAEAALQRREVASIAWPLSAITLLTPLTLHLVVATLFLNASATDFTWWIAASAIIVGLAHVTLVVMAVRYAIRVGKLSLEALEAAPKNRDWAIAYGVTLVASGVPGVLLAFVPPLLSVFTGIAFIPLMFRWIRSTIVRERQAIMLAREASAETLGDEEGYALGR